MDPYDIGEAFEAIEQELIASMIRNMERHRAEETKEGYEWAQWQAEQLKALEAYKKANRKKYAGKFKDINNLIDSAIYEARKQGNMEQEIEILEAIKKGFSAYSVADGDVMAEFFKLNDRKLEALIKATKQDFEKAEYAVLRMAEDQYRQIIYNAQVYANTGAATYEKAVDMASRDFLARGIACIEYANGARHTISDWADMSVRTAAKRAYLTGEGEKRKEWGVSTVIMNRRSNPCPKCLPFVGKVLIDDVWSGGTKKDGNYPLMSRAIELGLYHPRCKDSHSTYFEGISTPPDDSFSKKDIENIKAEYTAEQQSLYAKRQAQKYERLEKHSLDKENKQKYGARKQEWQKQVQANDKTQQILNTRYKAKDLDDMSTDKLRQIAEKKAAQYYKSGKSGISFGDRDPEQVAKTLAAQGSRTSLKKDILSIQKKMGDTIENVGESGIIKEKDLLRKTSNSIPFAHLEEKMSKKHIRELAKEYDIDMTGLSLTIDKNEELLRLPYVGRADPENIGGITFFPNAFKNKEELLRTIFHERQHVLQYKEYGVKYVQDNRPYFEKLAYAAEDEFVKRLKEEGRL